MSHKINMMKIDRQHNNLDVNVTRDLTIILDLIIYECVHDEHLKFDGIPVFMGSHCFNFHVTARYLSGYQYCATKW